MRNPTLAVDLTGTLHLAWEEPYAYGAASWGVCSARSTRPGGGLDRYASVSASHPSRRPHQINPDLAVDPVNGRVHIVWQDDRAADGLAAVYQVSSSNNGVTWGTPIKISGSYGPSIKPAIAVVDSGIAYAIWQDARNDDGDIYYSRSTNGGVTWSTKQGRVNDDDMTLFQLQFAPAIAANYAALHNNVYAAWADFRRSTWDVYATSLITCVQHPAVVDLTSGMVPQSITPNVPLTLSLQYAPSNATLPIRYRVAAAARRRA